MNSSQLLVTLLFSTLGGWMIGWASIQFLFSRPGYLLKTGGVLTYTQQHLAGTIGSFVQEQVNSSNDISNAISSPGIYEKMRPEIEKHVDYFLQQKLSTVFPLLYKFMGEKTLLQFRSAFLTEIDQLFPVIMEKYVHELKAGMNIDAMVAEKIKQADLKLIQTAIRKNLGTKLNQYKLFCAFAGLLTGIAIIVVSGFL